MTDNAKKDGLVPAPPASVVRVSSDLARRGLREVEATKQIRAEITDDMRRECSEMSLEELRQAVLTSYTTGLPNRRSFQAVETDRAANVVAVSMLDWLHFVGDQRSVLAKAKADVLREVQLEAYHDEARLDWFLYRGESSEELKSKLERARSIFLARIPEVSDPYGRSVFAGVDFTFGIGTRLREAEAMERLERGKPR